MLVWFPWFRSIPCRQALQSMVELAGKKRVVLHGHMHFSVNLVQSPLHCLLLSSLSTVTTQRVSPPWALAPPARPICTCPSAPLPLFRQRALRAANQKKSTPPQMRCSQSPAPAKRCPSATALPGGIRGPNDMLTRGRGPVQIRRRFRPTG